MSLEEYTGKKVYMGIDVHRRQYTVCCRCEGVVVKRASMPGRPLELVRFIGKHLAGAEVYSVYEAGFSGFGLHRLLTEAGVRSMVVHAASIEVSLKKAKTDRRDAQKMAEQLEAGRLKGIRVPSETEELLRLKTRLREQLVRGRTRLRNQIRMRLHYFGQIDPFDDRVLGRSLLAELRKEGLLPELDETLQAMERVWTVLDEEIRRIDKSLTEGVSVELVRLYRSVPGFGNLIAMTLARELGDLSQFSNEKQLFSFTGLTPSEFTTDDARHLGHITRQGSSRLRHLLVQAAWVAVKKDAAMHAVFNRIAAKAGKKRAIVAIARKLIGRARAVVMKKENYRLGEQKLAA